MSRDDRELFIPADPTKYRPMLVVDEGLLVRLSDEALEAMRVAVSTLSLQLADGRIAEYDFAAKSLTIDGVAV